MLYLENMMRIGSHFGHKGNVLKKIQELLLVSHLNRAIKLLQKRVLQIF